jgi:hypothetical protein
LRKHEKILRSRVNNKVKGLGCIRKIILEKGFIIRKEDRGGRYVVCERAWEDNQLSVVLSKFITEGVTKSDAHMYFNPKTHIEGLIKGRPIKTWRRKPMKRLIKDLRNDSLFMRSFDLESVECTIDKVRFSRVTCLPE